MRLFSIKECEFALWMKGIDFKTQRRIEIYHNQLKENYTVTIKVAPTKEI